MASRRTTELSSGEAAAVPLERPPGRAEESGSKGLSGAPAATLRREPLIEGQYQIGIIEELTGLEIQVELCSICCGLRGISLHHVVWRSHGGLRGTVLPLCLNCHERIHRREWEVVLDDDGMHVIDLETGEIIWRLKRWPKEMEGIAASAGDFIHLLDEVGEVTKQMAIIAPALKPDEAVEVYRALRDLGENGWKAQCRLIGEMHEHRLPGKSDAEKIEALSGAFGLRRSQLYSLLTVYRSFAESPIFDTSTLSQRYFVEASRAAEPEAWIALAQERKLTMPSFSSQDLAQEIRIAGARRAAPAAEAPVAPIMVWAKCSSCGVVGFHEKLPVGSDGQPVNISEYKEA